VRTLSRSVLAISLPAGKSLRLVSPVLSEIVLAGHRKKFHREGKVSLGTCHMWVLDFPCKNSSLSLGGRWSCSSANRSSVQRDDALERSHD
jgi:hypothetical protein